MRRKCKNPPKTHSRKCLIAAAVLLIVSILLMVLARRTAGFAEWYSSTLYPLWQGTLGRLSGLAPFSLSEVLLVLLPLILAADLIRSRRHLPAFAARLSLLLALLFFLYTANCGINYYRSSFLAPDLLDNTDLSDDLLIDYCEFVAGKLQESSASEGLLSADGGSGNAGEYPYPGRVDLQEGARYALQKLSGEEPALLGYYPKPKELTLLSPLFSMMGVSGIYSPFLIEANINGEMPAYHKPFTACHELSHLRGFMNEGEANYIGWLACIRSGDPAFERSGWLIAWGYAVNALYRVDAEKALEIRSSLPADVLRELEENHEFWQSHENRASDIQDQVNDAYLKGHGQEDGIRTYGQLTDLMLAWYSRQG